MKSPKRRNLSRVSNEASQNTNGQNTPSLSDNNNNHIFSPTFSSKQKSQSNQRRRPPMAPPGQSSEVAHATHKNCCSRDHFNQQELQTALSVQQQLDQEQKKYHTSRYSNTIQRRQNSATNIQPVLRTSSRMQESKSPTSNRILHSAKGQFDHQQQYLNSQRSYQSTQTQNQFVNNSDQNYQHVIPKSAIHSRQIPSKKGLLPQQQNYQTLQEKKQISVERGLTPVASHHTYLSQKWNQVKQSAQCDSKDQQNQSQEQSDVGQNRQGSKPRRSRSQRKNSQQMRQQEQNNHPQILNMVVKADHQPKIKVFSSKSISSIPGNSSNNQENNQQQLILSPPCQNSKQANPNVPFQSPIQEYKQSLKELDEQQTPQPVKSISPEPQIKPPVFKYTAAPIAQVYTQPEICEDSSTQTLLPIQTNQAIQTCNNDFLNQKQVKENGVQTEQPATHTQQQDEYEYDYDEEEDDDDQKPEMVSIAIECNLLQSNQGEDDKQEHQEVLEQMKKSIKELQDQVKKQNETMKTQKRSIDKLTMSNTTLQKQVGDQKMLGKKQKALELDQLAYKRLIHDQNMCIDKLQTKQDADEQLIQQLQLLNKQLMLENKTKQANENENDQNVLLSAERQPKFAQDIEDLQMSPKIEIKERLASAENRFKRSIKQNKQLIQQPDEEQQQQQYLKIEKILQQANNIATINQ